MNTSYKVPVAIIVGGIIIASAVYITMVRSNPLSPEPSLLSFVSPVTAKDHILGNPNAPVVIVEYADFDSNYSKDFHSILHQVLANEGTNGNVAWVFREFPLTELYPNAFKHAKAAECAALAGGNTAFWKFADILFLNQPADTTHYGAYAQSAGIPSDAFQKCYSTASSTIDAHIAENRQNALDLGAQGAPYSLILVEGRAPVVMDQSLSYDAVKLLLDQTFAQ